ncbi:hypothetical protein A3Q56_00743 [Intoshia linei]|uniref:Mitochondrial import inner membrane translocase subunit TIM50 n=1 Tax=Intoshia linei TaxID=1819745 RepID=A0A177BAX7_9BILA|nr:hypothetical protein A3Q56_00743 [Intoshia linei]
MSGINTGWRFKTRPGLDYLLSNVGPPLYEVVLFTHEDGANLYSIVDGIDPKGVLSYRLFRDSTNYINGTHVKDLSCLNRDLSKTIIVDCDPYAVQLQPQNALCLPSWKGKNDDKLYHLSNFLKAVATSGVEDVRDVLNHYSRYDDPLKAFTEKQKSINKQASTKEQPKPSLVKKLNRYK